MREATLHNDRDGACDSGDCRAASGGACQLPVVAVAAQPSKLVRVSSPSRQFERLADCVQLHWAPASVADYFLAVGPVEARRRAKEIEQARFQIIEGQIDALVGSRDEREGENVVSFGVSRSHDAMPFICVRRLAAHPGSHATWRLRLPGHQGTKCWFARASIQPGADDFAVLWLLFRTFLPQVGRACTDAGA
jgi:hypothetical protein